MCGIAGFSLAEGTTSVDVAKLTRALLLGIEPRGRDAAGIAWSANGDENVWYQKHNVRASLLLDSLDPEGARALIAHTRFATKGSPEKSVNNHPIATHGIVGVHNGQVSNDDELFAMLECPRDGQVDSEAAFALLAYGPDVWEGAEPWEMLSLLEGSAALAWMRVDEPSGTLHLARVHSSPLVVASTVRGSFLFASTEAALHRGAAAGGFVLRRVIYVPEGTYMKVENGTVVDVRTNFDLPDRMRQELAAEPLDVAYFDSEGGDIDWRGVSAQERLEDAEWDRKVAADDEEWERKIAAGTEQVEIDEEWERRYGHRTYKPEPSGAISRNAHKRSKRRQKRQHRADYSWTEPISGRSKIREPFPDYDPDNKGA